MQTFAGRVRPHRREVTQFLRNDAGLLRALEEHRGKISIANWLSERQIMQPVAAAANWDIPAIESTGALADWLALDVTDLLWLADLKGLTAKLNKPLLQHYHHRMLPKPSGQIRLIEIPKPRLKDLQRQILFHILNKIPPHPATHGFRRGRSIQTFAAPHVGRRIVLRMDLQDYFPSFAGARIAADLTGASLIGVTLVNTTAIRLANDNAAAVLIKSTRTLGYEHIAERR